jgi:hypothetical protein
MLALPNYSALGTLVTEDHDYYAARKAVENADGWRCLGTGATAIAYKSPCGSRVLKVVRDDDGNRATLDAALAHPDNPHLPTVYGVLDLSQGAFAVELEVLEPTGGGSRQFSQWESKWSAGRGRPAHRELPEHITQVDDCPMKDALIALHDAAQSYPQMCWDCHGGNLMTRPATGEIVLNDLLYGGSNGSDYETARATCERCGSSFNHYNEGAFVNDALWCDACVGEHAVFCEHAQEYVEAAAEDADVPDAEVLDALVATWLNDRPWQIRQGYVAADNRDAFAADDAYVWDGERFVEANLYAFLTALEGIARTVEEDLIQPRLPLAA